MFFLLKDTTFKLRKSKLILSFSVLSANLTCVMIVSVVIT